MRQLALDDLEPSPVDGRRLCGWCRDPIPPGRRRDAKFCGQSCRQAAHRFGSGMARRPATGEPLRLAYADPPYVGKAATYYGDHPDFGGEVDHDALMRQLATFDGWALSCSAESLPDLLRLPSCPTSARVGVWVKGERAHRAQRLPLNAWEPVIYNGGRLLDTPEGSPRRSDVLMLGVSPRLTDPARITGAKPADFIWWLFDLLGALPGDDLVDLFPGSGGVGRAWDLYTSSATTATPVAAAPLDGSGTA